MNERAWRSTIASRIQAVATQRNWWSNGLWRRVAGTTTTQAFVNELLLTAMAAPDPFKQVVQMVARQFTLGYTALWIEHEGAEYLSFHLEAESQPLTEQNNIKLPQPLWNALLDAPILIPAGAKPNRDLPPGLVPPSVTALLIPLQAAGMPLGILVAGLDRRLMFTPSQVAQFRELGAALVLFLELIRRSEALIRIRVRLHATTQNSMDWFINELDRLSDEMEPEFSSRVDEISEAMREQLDNLRGLMRGQYQRHISDIPELLRKTEQQHHVPIDHAVDIHLRISEPLQDDIYHWVREALNNIWKYASATRVHVSLAQHGDMLRLIVHDNGVGLNGMHRDGNRGGLIDMANSVAARGGTFDVSAMPYGGTRLLILLPMDGVDATPKPHP